MHYHHHLIYSEGLVSLSVPAGSEVELSHMFRRYKACMQSSFVGPTDLFRLQANATFATSYAWLESVFDSTLD